MSSNTATYQHVNTADLDFVLNTADERANQAVERMVVWQNQALEQSRKLNEALQVIESIADLPRGSMGATYTYRTDTAGRLLMYEGTTATSRHLSNVVRSLPDSDSDADVLPPTPTTRPRRRRVRFVVRRREPSADDLPPTPEAPEAPPRYSP
jgi:hypothetical protein